MSPIEPPAANEALKKIADEASSRIAAADAKSRKAQVAFAAGEFPRFFRQQAQEAEDRIQDEYLREPPGPSASSGDS